MKILITGNRGYIGSVLSQIFYEKGHEIVGCDIGFYLADDLRREKPENVGKQLVKDIRDVSVDDVRGCEALIDLANLADDPSGEFNPHITDEINHLGSVRLAEVAKKAGVKRYLFSSSCSVYGARGEVKIDENSEVAPITAYAKAKVMAENGIVKQMDENFTPVFMRNATVFGVSPRMRYDLVVNNLTCHAFVSKQVKLMSTGNAWRPNVHVEDVANAFLAALEADKEVVAGEKFNVGMDSENYRVLDIAKTVSECVPGSKVVINEGAQPDKRSYNVSFGKIKKLKGFRPHWNVREGVKQLYGHFRKIDLTKEKFESEMHHNVKRLKSLVQAGKIDSSLRFV